MSTVIEADFGPGHIAQAYDVDGEWVCILTPEAATDTWVQVRVRRFMWGQGRDCGTCRGCPVGRAQ